MSHKSFDKSPSLYLTFSAGTGFQYYRTLPAYFSASPLLPKQIRWSLGDDERLARELAKRINNSFDERAYDLSPEIVKRNPRHALKTLKDIHYNIKRFQKMASQAWQGLPSPTQLAKSDLSRGYERLQHELSQHVVLYAQHPHQRVRRTTTFTLGLMRLDQGNQPLPGTTRLISIRNSSLRVGLRLPAYSASAKVICFIGKLGRWNPGILPKPGSLLP